MMVKLHVVECIIGCLSQFIFGGAGGGRFGTMGGRSLDASFFGFFLIETFQSQTRLKRYYTTRVVRHRYITGTEEQQLHKISH